MILTREQVDCISTAEVFGGVTVLMVPADDLIDTARAYHDLRDAVLALCAIPLAEVGRVSVIDLREVVARVERGEQ